MIASAVILAGGKSSRMGQNKALLPIEGKKNIERIKDRICEVVDDIILITNEPSLYEFLRIPMFEDIVKNMGPLAGIQVGLMNSKNETNLFVACDMPFISIELAKQLLNKSDGYDAVVPVINGQQHPLFAVYKKSILPVINKCLEENRLRIKHMLEEVNVNYVTEKELSLDHNDHYYKYFYNMNNPQEYEEAKKMTEK